MRSVTTRPFHHGNLRAVLLNEAEAMLRETGVEGLSLRELARRAQVSHGAPRSHFIDRQALLDALAAHGFTRLTEHMRSTLAGPGPQRSALVRVAHTYVDFAVSDAALMELMFMAKTSARSGPVQDAAAQLFTMLDGALGGPTESADDAGARETFTLLFGATMQGIAALIASERVTKERGDTLVTEAMNTLLESRLGMQAVAQP